MKTGRQVASIRIVVEAKNQKEKKVTFGRLLFGIVAFAIVASAQEPAAQEAQSREEVSPQTGFYFNSPLNMSAVHEKNIPVGQGRFKDEVLLLTAPEFALRTVTARTDFLIGYKPEAQLFRHHPHLNTWDNAARFRLVHRPTSRWILDATNSFLQTEDPTRVLGGSIFLLPRAQFLENTFNINLDYNLSSRTKLSPSFLNTFSKLLLPNVRETDRFTGRFETFGSAAGVSLSHMLALQHQVWGGYTLFAVQDLKRGLHFPFAGGTNSITHGVSAGYRYGFAPRGISVELSAGLLHSGSNTYRVATRFEKRWASFVVATGYSREVAILAGLGQAASLSTGLLPSNFYQMVMLSLEGRLGSRWGLELRSQAGKSNSGLQIADIKSLYSHSRLSYRLTDRIYPFVGVDLYEQSYSELLLTSLARKRYFAGFSIVLSRPEEWQSVPPRTGEWSDDNFLLRSSGMQMQKSQR